MRSWWVAVATVALGSTVAASPLDQPAFTAAPADLLAEGKAVASVDADAVVLREEATYSLDDAGRVESRFRLVFAVNRQAAVDGWGTIRVGWSPFYQDKPTIHARVISGGTVSQLDQSLLTDAPTIDQSAVVFSDRRFLEAPLPRLAIGAVVEEEWTTKDRIPLLAAGAVTAFAVGRRVPVNRTIVTINAPATHLPKIAVKGSKKVVPPHRSTLKGVETVVYDFGATTPWADRLAGLPSDVSADIWIGFTTGSSWGAVASAYSKIVDQRIAAGPIELPADVTGTTQREVVDRALAWLDQRVRYTGIELSDAEIVPWSPAEVVKRGFGDCKDKATLLVALLRARGIRAEVALLDTGPGLDVARDLPGLGAFDHAIVHAIVNGKDLWIDPTEDLLPAGQLPARDQDRLALLATTTTRDLSATPASTSADNRIHETRAFHLAEEDKATVTETSTAAGTFTDETENWIGGRPRAELVKELGRYASDHYGGTVANVTGVKPTDLHLPFVLTVEVSDARFGFTGRDTADAWLRRTDVLLQVPSIFRSGDDEVDRELEKRKDDYVWSMPHTTEIEYRIELPPGYSLDPARDPETIALGTMTLTTQHRNDGNVAVVVYRLDTGRRRISPTELIATRAAVKKLLDEHNEHLVVRLTSKLLSDEGKHKEAIAECERMIAMHPKEALHYDQLAEAYRRAGMGPAARRAARKGVEVQPANTDAYAILAWELRHDSFGRDQGFDADRAGAIATYRRSLALDPKHIGALSGLAELIGYDRNGVTTENANDLAEAISLLGRAKAADKSDRYDKRLAEAQLDASMWSDAAETARGMPKSLDKATLLLTAAAARGATDLDALASSLVDPGDRDKLVALAFLQLARRRRYDAMRAVLPLSSRLSGAASVSSATKLVAVDRAKLDPKAPKTAVVAAMMAALGGVLPRDPPWNSDVTESLTLIGEGAKEAPALKLMKGFPDAAFLDSAVLAEAKVEGSERDGWRAIYEFGGARLVFYLVSAHGRAYVIGSNISPAPVGQPILDAVARGDLTTANRWLEWVVADQVAHGFAKLKTLQKEIQDTGAPATKADLETAAAILLARFKPELALPILKRCAGSVDRIKWCRQSEVDSLIHLERYGEAAEAMKADQGIPADLMLRTRALALMNAGRATEAVTELDDALAKSPDDVELLRARARAAQAQGDRNQVDLWFGRLTANPAAGIEDLNDAAWARLYFDPTPDKAKDLGLRIEQMSKKLPTHVSNTLAAVAAESDVPDRAHTFELNALPSEIGHEPGDADWYVFGRIAEALGLRDDAVAAYKRVKKPKTDPFPPSSYTLARRNLDRLGVK